MIPKTTQQAETISRRNPIVPSEYDAKRTATFQAGQDRVSSSDSWSRA
jgi:hypothetical protein